MKKLAIILIVIAALSVAAAPLAVSQAAAGQSAPSDNVSSWTHMAVAHLATKNVGPTVGEQPNSSVAEGMALFWLDQNMSQMNYMLFVSNATNITMAHIHVWQNGTPGPIVVWLYPGVTPSTTTPQAIPGMSNGMMVVGNFTAKDLVGPLQGKTMSDLVAQMNAGNTLAAWHSTEYPSAYMIGNITTTLGNPPNASQMKELGPHHMLQPHP